MKLRKERSIVAVYDAVSISKDIEVSGGPLTLNFYAESRSYIPNRFITPIILTPKIYVADPNKVIADGDKHSELTECIWYMNGERIVSDDAFKINKDNTLTVFKNSEKDYTISYSATWFDTRKKLNIYIEDSVQFITIALGDGNLLPRINIDKAQNWIHNPLKGEKKYSIKAYISKDKVYEGAVEWYYNYMGKPLVLFDEKCKFYVKGLYTNELIIDSSKTSNCVITAKNLSKEKLQLYYWFFDENGNPISNNEPVYKEISSKEPITLPVDTIEIAAKYNILGDTLLINNPSLLNITDKEFNKAYGINPEWDNHMEEVFGNEIGGRNLLLDSNRRVHIEESTEYVFITYKLPEGVLEPDKNYILSINLDVFEDKNAQIWIGCYGMLKGNIIKNYKTGKNKNITIHINVSIQEPNGETYITLYNYGYGSSLEERLTNKFTVNWAKLELGDKPTPWTPAPEDLNYRNLVINGLDKIRLTSSVDSNRPTLLSKYGLYYFRCKVEEVGAISIRVQDNTYPDLQIENGSHSDIYAGVDNPKLDRSGYYGSAVISSQMCINLTEKFGKGNEPTKEQCDEIFAHYGYITAPEDLNYPTIKPTTIESVLLPLTINSVSSTIGGLEKSSMEIKKSLSKNEGLTVTNIIEKGDFSNGINGWYYPYQRNPTTNNGWLTTEVESLSVVSRIDCVIKPTKDLLYMFFWAKIDFDSNIYATVKPNTGLITPAIKGKPTFTSNVIYGELSNKAYFYVPTSNASVGDKVEYSKCTIINLTQAFGAGNEPTKEWCDEHFKDYFDGTLLINIPIKKEDLSQYKITNLSSLKRLGTSVDYIENGTLHKSIELINFTGNETWVKEKAYSGIRYHMVLPYRVQGELLCNNFPTYNTITDLTTITPEGFSLVKGIYDKIYFTASDETTKPDENTQLLLLLHKPTSELLNTSGAINMKQGGTIFVENIITTDYLYNKGITLTSDYSIKLILSLTDNTSSLDINKCVIKDNIITHPDLQNGAYGTITYEYNSNTIKGLTTMKYMNVSDLLDTLWLEDIYTYKAKINPTGNITEWELVKLTDIENYEEWLSKDKLSENNLAPDGIIPGRYSTSVKYMRLYPSSLYVDFLAPTIVKDGTTKIKARAIVGTTDGILENPSQFFKVTWLKRNIKPGQLDVVIGTGNELVIDISNKDSITIEIEELPIK